MTCDSGHMLLRHVARPMLASWFVYDGVQAALHPAEHVAAAREGSRLVTERLGGSPLGDRQVATLVRVHGAATALAGVALAVGKAPRTAALVLAGLTVPLAVVDQPFTAPADQRSERTARFVRRVGAIGAALIAGVDYEGRPGVGWRVERARAERAATRAASARAAEKAAARATRRTRRASAVEHAVSDARRSAVRAVGDAQESAGRAARRAREAVADVVA